MKDIKTDDGLTTILSQKNEHSHSLDERKVERHQLRVSAKRKTIDDLSQRPSKIVRTSIKDVGESVLHPNDLKSVSKAIIESAENHNQICLSQEKMCILFLKIILLSQTSLKHFYK